MAQARRLGSKESGGYLNVMNEEELSRLILSHLPFLKL